MNIVYALLQFSLLCQVNPGNPNFPNLPNPSLPLPANSAAEQDNRKSYGWKLDEDGELCFIIQVSVREVQVLADNAQEKFSNMPVELIGRATRICVHVGDDDLPRYPSLEEIRGWEIKGDSIASVLGPGKLSDAESPVVMAQNDRLALPPLNNNPNDLIGSGFPQSTGNAPGTGNENAGQDFLNATRNPNELSAVDPNRRLPPTTGKFNSTAGDPNALARDQSDPAQRQTIIANPAPQQYPLTAPQNSPTPTVPSIPRIADNRAGINPNMYQSNPNLNSQANANAGLSYGQNLSDRLASQTGRNPYPPQTPNNYPPNNGYVPGSNQVPPQNYPPTQQIPQPPANSSTTLLASNPAGLATGAPNNTVAQNNNGAAATPPAPTDLSPSDTNNTRNSNSKPRTQSNQFLQVFFLLSLVVNFYLAVLIRKLLTRYRALLSSVRSQAA